MKLILNKPERWLLASVLLLVAVAVFGPHVPQPHTHDFADQRAWGAIPCALDVLSNLPFALWGLLGLAWVLGRSPGGINPQQRALAALFFAGLVLTSGASAWYHWQPDDAGLVIDRLGMVVAFAGVVGLAAADRVSARSGVALACLVLGAGAASVGVWFTSGQVLPWAVLQFGGMALVMSLAWLRPLAGALAVRWGQLIAIYAVAKALEMADSAVFELTQQLVSGHSLKHVVASCAAWPVVVAVLGRHKESVGKQVEIEQNPAQPGARPVGMPVHHH